MWRCVLLLAVIVLAISSTASAQSVPALGVHLAFDRDKASRGPLVVDVVPGSMAERLEIRLGDRLLRVGPLALGNQALVSAGAPVGILLHNALSASDTLVVLVLRDGITLRGVGSLSNAFRPLPLMRDGSNTERKRTASWRTSPAARRIRIDAGAIPAGTSSRPLRVATVG